MTTGEIGFLAIFLSACIYAVWILAARPVFGPWLSDRQASRRIRKRWKDYENENLKTWR